MKVAIVAITVGGVELGMRLREGLEGSDLFIKDRGDPFDDFDDSEIFSQGYRTPPVIADSGDGTKVFRSSLQDLVAELFRTYDGIVFIMATGIVVRIVAPFLRGKEIDPAVVTVDETGRYAISLLSGHLGGANDLAIEVAEAIEATAVITTATDSRGKPSAEGIAKELGCEIDNVRGIKRVNSAFLHDEPVAINLHVDKRGLLAEYPRAVFYDTIEGVVCSNSIAKVVITNRLLSEVSDKILIMRPKNLVVGVGCNRNTSEEEIEDVVNKVLHAAGLSEKSIKKVASIDVKSNETGLLDYAKRQKLKIEFYSREELEKVPLASPSSRHVMEAVGVGGVCEPAALLGSNGGRLLIQKVKSGNVTVAVAELV